jgi:tyrosinase
MSLLLVFFVGVILTAHPAVDAASVADNANNLNQNFFSYFSGEDDTFIPLVRPGSKGPPGPVWKGRPGSRGGAGPDPNKIDLLFVMDNSGSIGSTNFVKQKIFVSLMIDHVLTVTCSKSIRIAVISFAASHQIKIEFDFNDHSLSASPRVNLKNAVNAITYVHGPATNTAGALDLAHSLLNDASRGARSDATKIVFVLTDGKSNQGGAPGPKADILRNTDGAIVFAMGVANFGSTSSQNELKAIASDPDSSHVLVVDDFDDMEEIAARFGAKPRCNLIDMATHRQEDWNSILIGFRTLKQNGVVNDLAALHDQVFTVFGSAHNGAGFLPWHRAFLSMIEHAIQIARNDFSLRLPYWNWAGEHVATSAIWTHLGGSTNNGDPGAGNCVNTGPFRRVLWHPDPSECIIRNIFNPMPGTQQASQAQLNSDRTNNPNYEDFREQTESEPNRHNTLHNRFGFPSDMSSGESPRDPLFYFHHCFIDKLWYDWQEVYGDGPSNYPAVGEIYNLNTVMGFLTAAYPSPSVPLLKQPTWNRPVNLLRVGDLGYTYDQSSGPTFGRRKRATYTVPAPQLSVALLRKAIAGRHPSRLEIDQWDFDTQCWFESDGLTASQKDLCVRRDIVVSLLNFCYPKRCG